MLPVILSTIANAQDMTPLEYACNNFGLHNYVHDIDPLNYSGACKVKNVTVPMKAKYPLNNVGRDDMYKLSSSPLYNELRSQGRGVVGTYASEWSMFKRRGAWVPGHINQEALTHVLHGFLPICLPSTEPQLALCTVNDCCDPVKDGADTVSPYFTLLHVCSSEESHYKVTIFDGYASLCAEWNKCGLYQQWHEVKQLNPDLKLLPSVGGWSLSRAFFHLFEGDRLDTFVESCVDFLKAFPMFDGIDIDWEFPGGGGADDGSNSGAMYIPTPDYMAEMESWVQNGQYTSADWRSKTSTNVADHCAQNVTLPKEGSEQDGANYVELIKRLSTAVKAYNPSYQVTSAVSSGLTKVQKIDYLAASNAGLDHLFLMSYDFMGGWSMRTGHQTNLYGYSDSNDESIDRTVDELLLVQGFPPEKLVIGVAMYGRGWTNVQADNMDRWYAGGQGEAKSYGPIEDGVTEYNWITEVGCDISYDECTYGGLAICDYQGDKHYFTMDTVETAFAKGAYVRDRGLGGLFAWVIDQDDGTILNAMGRSLYDDAYISEMSAKVSLHPAGQRCDYATGTLSGPAPGASNTPAPATPAPATPAPATPAPATPAPATPAPATPAPATPAPATPAPVTPAPVTPAPATPAPATPAPVTPAPVTPGPPAVAPPSTGGGCCKLKAGVDSAFAAFCDTTDYSACGVQWAYCDNSCTPAAGGSTGGGACCTSVAGFEAFGAFCNTTDSEVCARYPAYCNNNC